MTTRALSSPSWTDAELDLAADSYDRPGQRRPRPSLVSPLTWSEVVHGVANFVVSIPFFVIPVVLLCVGAGLSILYVGIPLFLGGLLFARAAGHVQRAMGYALLGTYVRRPPRIVPTRKGAVGWTLAIAGDGASWRALTYHIVTMVLAPVQFAFTVSFLGYGLGGVTYWMWRPYLPLQTAADGSLHRGGQLLPDVFLDTVPRMIMTAAVGVVILLLMPYVVRFFTDLDRALMRVLLGPAPF